MASAGASATSATSCSFTKDDKIKFLRTIKEIAENNVPATKVITFENILSESDINWIDTQIDDINGLFDVYSIYTINYCIDTSDSKSVIINCSLMKSNTKLICDDIEQIINYIDVPAFAPRKDIGFTLGSKIMALHSIEDTQYAYNKLNLIFSNFSEMLELINSQHEELEKLRQLLWIKFF